jgi:hypothetical protein
VIPPGGPSIEARVARTEGILEMALKRGECPTSKRESVVRNVVTH